MNIETPAVVVGGSSGIGAAIAHELLRLGKTTIIASRNPEKFVPASESVETRVRTRHLPVDVTSDESVQTFFESIRSEYAGVACLFYCSGLGAIGTLTETAPREAAHLIQIHLLGLYRVLHFGESVLSAAGCLTVVIGSRASNFPVASMVAYGVSKAAVPYLARAVAQQFKSGGGRIIVVNPGATDTPLRRRLFSQDSASLMTADMVAKAAVGLLGREFELLNGSVIDLPW